MKKESKGFTCFLNKPVASSFFYATAYRQFKISFATNEFEFIKCFIFNLFLFKENVKK